MCTCHAGTYMVIVLLTQTTDKAAVTLCYTSCNVWFTYTSIVWLRTTRHPSLEGGSPPLSTSESLESLTQREKVIGVHGWEGKTKAHCMSFQNQHGQYTKHLYTSMAQWLILRTVSSGLVGFHSHSTDDSTPILLIISRTGVQSSVEWG